MKKNSFIESALILMIGGFITKILGLFIKIITIRYVGVEGSNLYMLIVPTFSLFITLSQLGFPVAISKLIGEEKRNNRKIIFSVIPISLLFNLVLMGIVILLSPFISRLLHDHRTLYPLLSIALTLPFISISGIVRGYFFGKSQMVPHTISHIVEQMIRLISIILFIPPLLNTSIVLAVVGIVVLNIISELGSIIVLIHSIPKHEKIKIKDLKPDRDILKDIFHISIPTTSARLIGSFTFFLEPILLTFFLMLNGYSSSFIIKEYGLINAYVLPLLMIPSFFSQAISSALIPVISRGYINKQFHYIKTKFKQAVALSLGIGLITTLLFILIPEWPLKIVFNTQKGVSYIRLLAPFFLFYYVQIPILSTLQAINQAKHLFYSSLVGSIIKLSTIILFSFFHIGLYPLILSIIINVILVTFYNYYQLKKAIN